MKANRLLPLSDITSLEKNVYHWFLWYYTWNQKAFNNDKNKQQQQQIFSHHKQVYVTHTTEHNNNLNN